MSCVGKDSRSKIACKSSRNRRFDGGRGGRFGSGMGEKIGCFVQVVRELRCFVKRNDVRGSETGAKQVAPVAELDMSS